MAAAAALAHVGRPRVHLADSIGKPDLALLFPRAFADWRVDRNLPILLPAPDVQAKLDAIYNQVLARTYVNAFGERVMVSVAYGGDQSDGTRAHRPEICYPAQGFQILYDERGFVPMQGAALPVRRLMSRLGARHEPITYWLVVGSRAVTSGAEQKWIELRYGLAGVIPDGMLVRLSSIDTDMKRGHELQARFAAAMYASMSSIDRARIFGSR